MLEELMRECKNWFVVPGGVHLGRFAIEKGRISLPFLKSGQYFWIAGSVFNDGLYQYGSCVLQDEEFTGAVWALAVPAEVVKLAEDVQAWRDTSEKAAQSPYQSESFGGYSYTKASGGTAQGGSALSWQSVFSARLKKWRKL